MRGTKNEKRKLFDKRYNFYIINFESFRMLMTKRVPHSEKVIQDEKTGEITRKKINREVIDNKRIKEFIERKFNVIIIDESHKIKSQSSLIFRIIKKISRGIKNRILLTGTPFGQSLLDVWSQYYIIDFGETFMPNFQRFSK